MSEIDITEAARRLDPIRLDRGGHSPGSGKFCWNEAAAYAAGEPHSSMPECVSPVIRAYCMRLQDQWGDADRQLLKPYILPALGTAGDGKDAARLAIAQRALVKELLPPWLRLAGLDADADKITGMGDAGHYEVWQALRNASQHARERRREWRRQIETKVRERLKGEVAADAAAEVTTAAVAFAAADAAAEAVATATATATAAAAAEAVATAAAEAVAAAVAATAAVAANPWGAGYGAAKKIWVKLITESDAAKPIRDLAAAQRGQALSLLDQMIEG